MVDIERVSSQSMDIETADLEKLRAVFPQCFSEGKLDISKLLALFGQYDDNDFEKYKFEWKGKSECYRIAGKRSTGTLRPCPEESVNFDTTNNIYIEGDNLEVLKLLQSSYYNKVKMIYIDPPYNTGNDFVYEDDFKDPMAKYKEVTQQTTKSNPETMGRFHTNWLNMMYPRLRLAANLLRDDGVIFISIDDNEVTNLRRLCDEVFGEENFVAQINWKGRGGRQDSKYYAVIHEYIVCYAKNISEFNAGEEIKIGDVYPKYDKERNRYYKTQLARKWGSNSKRNDRPNLFYPITAPDGTDLYPMLSNDEEGCWRWSKTRMTQEITEGNVEFSQNNGVWVAYEKIWEPLVGEEATKKYTTWIDDIGTGKGSDIIKELFNGKVFDYPKPVELLIKFIKMADVADDDIILDFFSGSATTAHAVMQLNAEDGGNRQFIMVQLPELCDEKSEAYKAGYKNICEIGKERIRRAGAKISKGDIGFKVFKLDTSNLVEWDSTPTQDEQIVAQRFSLLNETIKPDRTDLDVIYEVMLKMGIPLTYKVISTQINDKKAYSIGEDCLVLICLDYGKDGITPEDIKEMCELIPAKIVSSEQAFKDSTALSNAYYILKDKDIEMKLL